MAAERSSSQKSFPLSTKLINHLPLTPTIRLHLSSLTGHKNGRILDKDKTAIILTTSFSLSRNQVTLTINLSPSILANENK